VPSQYSNQKIEAGSFQSVSVLTGAASRDRADTVAGQRDSRIPGRPSNGRE